MTAQHDQLPTGTAGRGIELVLDELTQRHLDARWAPAGRRRNAVEATRPDGSVVRIDVKTRTAGTWQTQYTDGRANPTPDPTHVVVFVDLTTSPPLFFVVPRDEYEREVYLEHADYVRRYGERPPDGSKHHAVVTSSVQEWIDRWDLITGQSPPE